MPQIVDNFGNPIASERPVTLDYKPGIRHIWGRNPRDLPLFSFQTIQYMMIDQTIRLGLAMRMAPICSAEFAYREQGEWKSGVKADNPEVADFVERQLERIWRHDVAKILAAQVWGWSAGEVMYKVVGNRIEFDTILERHSRDVRTVRWKGRVVGVEVLRLQEGKDKVRLGLPGKAFWHSFDTEAGKDYGRSVLIGPYSAWADKWLEGGALDVRRLYMHADAYAGRRIGYPPGTTEIPGEGDVPNRDVAREMAEQYKSGDVMVYPQVWDEDGKPLWDIQDAKVHSNPSHILQYPKDLDIEMLRGMEIPDEVVTSMGGGGAWQGKQVPMQAFYNGLNLWGNAVVKVVVTQILEPLVKWNFGEDEAFEANMKPLDIQAMESQGANQQQQGPMGPATGGFGQEQPGGFGQEQPGGFGQEAGGFGQEAIGQEQNGNGVPFPGASQRFALNPVRAVGEGVLSAAQLVQAANEVIERNTNGHTEARYDPIPQPAIRIEHVAVAVEQNDSTKPGGEVHEYSSLICPLPLELAMSIREMSSRIDGSDFTDEGTEDEPHITLKYGLHCETDEAVRHVLKDVEPILVMFGKTSIFECDECDVVKVEVESQSLDDINKLISDAIPNTDTYPEYIPHATVARVLRDTGYKYEDMDDLEGKTATISQVTFSGKTGITSVIELSGRTRMAVEDWNFNKGPRGGSVWTNVKTGEIRRQKENPGGKRRKKKPESTSNRRQKKEPTANATTKLMDELASGLEESLGFPRDMAIQYIKQMSGAGRHVLKGTSKGMTTKQALFGYANAIGMPSQDFVREGGVYDFEEGYADSIVDDDMHKELSEWTDALNEKERDAVMAYATGSPINKSLRECPDEMDCLDEEEKDVHSHLEKIIDKANGLSEPMLAWRGVGGKQAALVVDQMKKAISEGKTMHMNGIQSFSVDPTVAALYVDDAQEGVVFEVMCKSGAYVASMSFDPNERELLHGHGQRYRPLRVLKDVAFSSGNQKSLVTVIQMEQL